MGVAAGAPTAGEGLGRAGTERAAGRKRCLQPGGPGQSTTGASNRGFTTGEIRAVGSDLAGAAGGRGGSPGRMFSSRPARGFLMGKSVTSNKGSKQISKGRSFVGGMLRLLIQAPEGYRRWAAGSLTPAQLAPPLQMHECSRTPFPRRLRACGAGATAAAAWRVSAARRGGRGPRLWGRPGRTAPGDRQLLCRRDTPRWAAPSRHHAPLFPTALSGASLVDNAQFSAATGVGVCRDRGCVATRAENGNTAGKLHGASRCEGRAAAAVGASPRFPFSPSEEKRVYCSHGSHKDKRSRVSSALKRCREKYRRRGEHLFLIHCTCDR